MCPVFLKMKMTLNTLERKILSAVQYGLPMSPTPYQDISAKVGIPVAQLLDTLRRWETEKKIRRTGAIVNHFQMGHGVGAMVVWNVPEDKVDKVGELFASFPKVSHAYLRPPNKQWPYNFYTMIHARCLDELQAAIETMSQKSGITEFRALKTVRELKKIPPTYIVEEQ